MSAKSGPELVLLGTVVAFMCYYGWIAWHHRTKR